MLVVTFPSLLVPFMSVHFFTKPPGPVSLPEVRVHSVPSASV